MYDYTVVLLETLTRFDFKKESLFLKYEQNNSPFEGQTNQSTKDFLCILT